MIKPIIRKEFSNNFDGLSLKEIDLKLRIVLAKSKILLGIDEAKDACCVGSFTESEVYNALKRAIIALDKNTVFKSYGLEIYHINDTERQEMIDLRKYTVPEKDPKQVEEYTTNPLGSKILEEMEPIAKFEECGLRSRLCEEDVDKYLVQLINDYCSELIITAESDDKDKYNATLNLIEKYFNSPIIKLCGNIENEISYILSIVLDSHSKVYKRAISESGFKFSSPLHQFYKCESEGERSSLNNAYFNLLNYLENKALDYILSSFLLKIVLLHDLFSENESFNKDANIKEATNSISKNNEMESKKGFIEDIKNGYDYYDGKSSLISVKKTVGTYIHFNDLNEEKYNAKFKTEHLDVYEHMARTSVEYRTIGDKCQQNIAVSFNNDFTNHKQIISHIFRKYENSMNWLNDYDANFNFEHYSVHHNLNARIQDNLFLKEYVLLYLDNEKLDLIPIHISPYISHLSAALVEKTKKKINKNLYFFCEKYQADFVKSKSKGDTANAKKTWANILRDYNIFNSKVSNIIASLPKDDVYYRVNEILFNDCTHPIFFSSIHGNKLFSHLSDKISFSELYKYHVGNEFVEGADTQHSILESAYYLQLLSLLMIFDVDLNELNEYISNITSNINDNNKEIFELDDINSIYRILYEFLSKIVMYTNDIICESISEEEEKVLWSDKKSVKILIEKINTLNDTRNIFLLPFENPVGSNEKLIVSYLIHYNMINGRVPKKE